MKKPLRVIFYSNGVMEEGIDQGGVTKEFFQLVTRALFNEARPCCRSCSAHSSSSHWRAQPTQTS